ncbi:hypothetical protein ACQKP0_18545 [Heyndrickxia sp. NPDC080065]|uniref:hypothetical protein n=1 Tax=Heyndrickxia sp. NPDC080065 TaxID=3390568 RepID=UPI003D04A37A
MGKKDKIGKIKDQAEILSFTARKKWLSIPEEFRKKIEHNVWCSSCRDAVQIEKYAVKETRGGLLLQGICKTCGNEIVRVVD